MAASKQASKHTHARAQCSPASVGLAQARPNNQKKKKVQIIHSLAPALTLTLTITLILNHLANKPQQTTSPQSIVLCSMQLSVSARVTSQCKLTFEPLTSPHGVGSTKRLPYVSIAWRPPGGLGGRTPPSAPPPPPPYYRHWFGGMVRVRVAARRSLYYIDSSSWLGSYTVWLEICCPKSLMVSGIK